MTDKRVIIFIFLTAACFLPQVKAPLALACGIGYGLTFGPAAGNKPAIWSKKMLQISVVGLGFGMNLPVVLATGRDAIGYTLASIVITMLTGMFIGRLCGSRGRAALLVSFGTAICGGSAIAAMAPVIKAETEETGVALATVFTLNALALLLFPALGHLAGLGEQEFGKWAALAIHDTSSVVGATAAYGQAALATGTTIKLARALWIVPSVMVAAWWTKSRSKAAFPVFIVGFLAAAAVRTAKPDLNQLWHGLYEIAKQLLVVTLFLIGSGLTRDVLKKTGFRLLAQGCLLWLAVSALTLAAIMLRLL